MMPEMTFHIDFRKQQESESLIDWLDQFDIGYPEFFPAYLAEYESEEGWNACDFVWFDAPAIPFTDAVQALNQRLAELGFTRLIVWEDSHAI